MKNLIILILLFVYVPFAVEAIISFGKLTPDEDIIELLDECNAKIRVIWYASPYGGGGSGAEREWYKPREFFQKSRKQLLEGYEIGYLNSVANFRIILENGLLSAEDLAEYPKLLKFIKGLLNNYYQQKESYFYIKSGGPITYAALVKTDNVSCLEKSKLVKDISVNYFPLFTAFLKYIPCYFRPKKYNRFYFLPKIKNAKPKELYKRIEMTVKEHENNKNFVQHYEKFYIKTGFYEKRLNFLRHLIEKNKLGRTTIPTYYPSDGDIFYTGTNVVEYNIIQWDLPGDWSVEKPGYEHDLVTKSDYFTGCYSSSNLPDWYDDCPTACISEAEEDYCAFSLGTYNALLIEPEYPYTGWIQLIRGPANSTDFYLNAQEVFHSPKCFEFMNRYICLPCPFDNPWCMGGTPYRNGNPDLNCPVNSLALNKCFFRRWRSYYDSWIDKYDCNPAPRCDEAY